MIWKLIFIICLFWVLLRLVQIEKLTLDIVLFTLLMIVIVLSFSFSPFFVEGLAKILGFGTPALAVVALVIAGLIVMCVILAVLVSSHKKELALVIRQLAKIELRILREKNKNDH
jgi:hypothetical protein